jgi:hypothetical protein
MYCLNFICRKELAFVIFHGGLGTAVSTELFVTGFLRQINVFGKAIFVSSIQKESPSSPWIKMQPMVHAANSVSGAK